MKDSLRKLYLPPDCLALTDAQLRVVNRRCLSQLLTEPIRIAYLAVLMTALAFCYWLGLFRDDGRFGILSPMCASVAMVLLSEGLVLFWRRRSRSVIAAYVRNNMEQIEAEARHPGVRVDYIPILEHPEYGRFIGEDPERRHIYWDDLPRRFGEWIKTRQQAEQGVPPNDR